MTNSETFNRMKQVIHTILPDARVILFGSRANNTATEESDWDLIILDKNTVDKKTRRAIHYILYPLSLELFTTTNSVVANQDEWENNTGWYALRLSVSRNPVLA
jgi:predicted nucleotidyltransferase